MKVLLVFASYEFMKNVTSHQFPLGLGYLAAYLHSKDIEVKIADLRHENKREYAKLLTDYKPDIVGISCMTPNQNEAYKTARTTKRILSDSLVILGGVHATFMYDEILRKVKEIDIVAIGEGEITLHELCTAWQNGLSVEELSGIRGIAFRNNGSVTVTPAREKIENLDVLPVPAFDLAVLPDIKTYFTKSKDLPVLTSRGCPFKCAFCSTSVMHGQKYRKRDPVKIVDELEYLKNRFNPGTFSIVDDTFTVDKERTKKICYEIIRRNLNINWGCSARVDTLTPDMIKIMRKAGCQGLFFGIESLSDEVLKNIKKGFTARKAMRMVKMAMDEGITVDASFILGLPGDNLKNTGKIYDFVKKYKVNGRVLTNTLQILPGTDMYLNPDYYGIKYSKNYKSTWANSISFAKDLPFTDLLKEKIKIQAAHFENRFEDPRLYEIPYPLVNYDDSELTDFAS
ncbi:MAG: radical SAM protein [Prolixibacteraceae bacterium]|nr:radical SAM protein [Prolixibacteraceae bacterium]